MEKLIRLIESVFHRKKFIAQCYECGKMLEKDGDFIIDPFFTTEQRRLKNAFNHFNLKDTYCTSCKDFLTEANRIVNREW